MIRKIMVPFLLGLILPLLALRSGHVGEFHMARDFGWLLVAKGSLS